MRTTLAFGAFLWMLDDLLDTRPDDPADQVRDCLGHGLPLIGAVVDGARWQRQQLVFGFLSVVELLALAGIAWNHARGDDVSES